MTTDIAIWLALFAVAHLLIVRGAYRAGLTDGARRADPRQVEIRYVKMKCDRAPDGWRCTRDFDHDGPCAAERIAR
jgi:hypothetical protein